MHAVVVSPDESSMRLDVFLARHVPDCSRRNAQRAIARGAVRINGHPARKGENVRPGDLVQVEDSLYEPPQLQPNPGLTVAILHQDASLLVLDKPAGMPGHALRPEEMETVANFLLAFDPQLASVGNSPFEAGMVHRLDIETSGVLLVARTAATYRALRAQFSAHQVEKQYCALVSGDVATHGAVDVRIAHDRDHRKMRVCAAGERTTAGRSASTVYRPVERFGRYTLLDVDIRTGVMHQIRVHLASIGHAVLGDRVYGAPVGCGGPSRHLLHASRLAFKHPDTATPMRISSPLPADFATFLEGLHARQGPTA